MTDGVLKVEMTELALRPDVGCERSGTTPNVPARGTRRIKLPFIEMGRLQRAVWGAGRGRPPLGVLNYNVHESSKQRC